MQKMTVEVTFLVQKIIALVMQYSEYRTNKLQLTASGGWSERHPHGQRLGSITDRNRQALSIVDEL